MEDATSSAAAAADSDSDQQVSLGGLSNLSSDADDAADSPDEGKEGDEGIFDGLIGDDDDDDTGVEAAASRPGVEDEGDDAATSFVDTAVSFVRNLFVSSPSSPSSPVASTADSSSASSAVDDTSSTADAKSVEVEADAKADVDAKSAAAAADGKTKKGRSLAKRKYVQTKERNREGATKKGTTLTKELRLRLRRRRRRRRKRGQTLSDRAEEIREKKNAKTATPTRNKAAPNVALPFHIQDREGDASSSSEDKEFADRASSRTRDSGDAEEAVQGDSVERDAPREQHDNTGRPNQVSAQQQQQQSDSKGGQSETDVSEDEDDGPQMVSGPPIAADTRLRWRCAYPGGNVQTTDIPESVSMQQQTSFPPAKPASSVQKTKNWLKGWSAKRGGFGRKGNDDNDGNRRAAEQSKGGGGPQLVSPGDVKDKLYILPEDHDLCKDMKFVCPALCADRPDYVCRESFTCKFPAPPSMIVTRPAEEDEERPSGQKRLPPLPIDNNSGSGKGKGGHASTYRTQAGGGGSGGKGGSSSDDYNTYKKHRDGRPRNLVEGDDDAEEDSFDADSDFAEDEGRDLDDSFDDAMRDLQGNSKGTAKPLPTSTPASPQLINVDVKPICTSTNYQILPDDYYICSHMEPPPEPECPKELPENDKDYDTLVDKLPNRCKEPEDPDFAPPAPPTPGPNPPVAIDDDYTATITNPTVSDNILDNDFDIDVGDVISITKITIPGGPNREMTDIAPSGGTISATFPSGGVVTINPLTGEMDYDASDVVASIPAGETFVETFTYQIVDTMGQTAMATVTITIEGGNSPPVANPDRYTATKVNSIINANIVLENDTDPDGDDLTVTKITKPGMPGEDPVAVFPSRTKVGTILSPQPS